VGAGVCCCDGSCWVHWIGGFRRGPSALKRRSNLQLNRSSNTIIMTINTPTIRLGAVEFCVSSLQPPLCCSPAACRSAPPLPQPPCCRSRCLFCFWQPIKGAFAVAEPEATRGLRAAFALQPANGRLVDFDPFSNSQVGSFGHCNAGCRRASDGLLLLRVEVTAGLGPSPTSPQPRRDPLSRGWELRPAELAPGSAQATLIDQEVAPGQLWPDRPPWCRPIQHNPSAMTEGGSPRQREP
jgi:hypothetical protein